MRLFLKSTIRALLRILLGPVLRELAELEEKLGQLALKVDNLTPIKEDLHNRHLHIDRKQDLHTRLLSESNDKHDTQLNYLKHTHLNQNFSIQAPLGDALRPQFLSLLHRVLGADYQLIQAHAEQLFSDVLIGHLNPGGIWRLQEEIGQFFLPPSPPRPVPAPNKSSPLKICIVSGCFPSLMHGGGGRLFDIIAELSATHHLDLFTHYNPALDASSLDQIRSKVEHLKLVEDYELLTVEAVAAWLRAINRDVAFYDIIQLEYPQTVKFIQPLRKYGKRIGFTFMECLAKSHTEKLQAVLAARDYNRISTQAKEFWTALADEKYALEHTDFSIAVTDDDAGFLHRLSTKPPHIVPTCLSRFAILDEAIKYREVQPAEKSVIFIGFFGHWPNLEAMEWYLTSIHPLVKVKIPDYHFTIVGSGEVNKLHQLSAGDQTVTVAGQVESIVPHILQAKVCISPLISGAGIRGKQNQYAVLGRPSVTTTIGNMGLVYTHGDSVLIADQAEEFAAAIVHLLTDQALYLCLQKRAQELALANYTWPKHLAKLLAIYQGHEIHHG